MAGLGFSYKGETGKLLRTQGLTEMMLSRCLPQQTALYVQYMLGSAIPKFGFCAGQGVPHTCAAPCGSLAIFCRVEAATLMPGSKWEAGGVLLRVVRAAPAKCTPACTRIGFRFCKDIPCNHRKP
eukprot:1158309-Pelagomonas_calceolata.AAC.9